MNFSLGKINFINIIVTAFVIIMISGYMYFAKQHEYFKLQVKNIESKYISSKKEFIKTNVTIYINRFKDIIKKNYELVDREFDIELDNISFLYRFLKNQRKFIEMLQDYTLYDKKEYIALIDTGLEKALYQSDNRKFFEKSLFPEIINQIKNNNYSFLVKSRKIKIKYLDKNLYIVLYKNRQLIDLKAKKEIFSIIDKERFGKNGEYYIWIHSLKGYMVHHPIIKSLNYKKMIGYQSSDGQFYFKEMNDLVEKQKEGFLEYKWHFPNSRYSEEKKISFVKKFDYWDWVVGSGFYFRDIDLFIKNEQKNFKDKMFRDIYTFSAVLSFIFILISILAYILYKKIEHIENQKEKNIALLEQYKLILNHSAIVAKASKEGNLLFVNEYFTKISGFENSDVLDKHYEDIIHDSMSKDSLQEMLEDLRSGKIWSGILFSRYKRRDDILFIQASIMPLKDENGEILEYIMAGQDISDVVNESNKVDNIKMVDSLTGLDSRLKLLEDLEQEGEKSLAILDVLNFSDINKIFGENIGDLVIKEVAKEIFEFANLRDIHVYRMCADVFSLLDVNHSYNEFIMIINDLQSYLNSFGFFNNKVKLNFVIGLSNENRMILSSAYIALKEAKSSEKSLVLYNIENSVVDKYKNKILYVDKIISAVNNGKIITVYEKIYSLKQESHNYELLVKLLSEDNSEVGLERFLPIIKKTNLYEQILKIAIDNAIKECRENKKYKIFINLFLDDLYDENIVNTLLEKVKTEKISNQIVLEISDLLDIDYFKNAFVVLENFSKYGIDIALDNFGSKKFDLECLDKFKLSYIKIDGYLSSNLHIKSRRKMFNDIISYCRRRDIKTIALGVNSKNIFDDVTALGADYVQGSYIINLREYKC